MKRYVSILSLVLSLIKQQCKAEWIQMGDDCIRFFFTKAKQRKLATYIYSLKDQNGEKKEGFDEVAKIISSFYSNLLGK